jgi:predicted anti-sigma-YlaC factor YlaD
MGCKKIEKWLSDRIDEELSQKKIKALDAHLKKCAVCRSYAASIEKIHDEAKSMGRQDASPAFWEGFVSRLKVNLNSPRQEKKERRPVRLGWNWVWSGTAILIVVIIGLYLLFFQSMPSQEMYVFSLDNSLTQIYQEIGNDSELEELFNSIVIASIGESLGDSEWVESPDFFENLLLWEDLTEEEIKFLESEIKEDVKL